MPNRGPQPTGHVRPTSHSRGALSVAPPRVPTLISAPSSDASQPADPAVDNARASHPKPAGINEWAGDTAAGVHWRVIRGDSRHVLRTLDDNRFACVVTSPPYYWQRDYQVDNQIGLETSISDYVTAITDTMSEVRRVLSRQGGLFLNLADTYYSAKGQPKGRDRKNRARRFGLRAVDAPGLGVPRKTLIGIPWRVSLAMIDRGWILRSPIVWRRETPMPEPTAKDRPWRTYEMVFMFTQSPRYGFNRPALENEEDVWTISTRPRPNQGLHPASFPDALVRKCLDVGCPPGGEVLDPFAGTGTTLTVAVRSGRPAVGVDLKKEFCGFMASSLQRI